VRLIHCSRCRGNSGPLLRWFAGRYHPADVNRRAFITGLGALLAAPPAAVDAQRAGKIASIGYLAMGRHPSYPAFVSSLRELGYTEGRHVVFEPRLADIGKPEQFDDLATDLVRRHVDVIVALLNPEIAAAKRATSAIPIVMVISVDPVGQGFVRSLASPGGNLTGQAWDPDPAIFGKLVGFVRETLPGVSRIGALVDSKFPASAPYLAAADHAARNLRIAIVRVEIGSPSEINMAFSAMTKRQVESVVVFGGSTFFTSRATLADVARQYKLPIAFPWREGAAAGGLLSFGPSLPALWRGSATYVDRILKGARPADLPIEQPTTFELVINLTTAKTLGLTIPPALLLRADQVIE
jgi:putative tryptophan/tyrosine transport system substrate-binding protein